MGKCCFHASSFIFYRIIIKVLVTRTGIKAWTSLISGRIRLLILELLALEWRKFQTFGLKYLWSQLANLDRILCVASLGWGKNCIRFWAVWIKTLVFMVTESPHWLIMGKMMSPPFLGCFTFEWFALIAEKTIFDFGTLDSGERSLPFGLLVFGTPGFGYHHSQTLSQLHASPRPGFSTGCYYFKN